MAKNEVIKSVDATIKNWNANVTNPNKNVIDKLLKYVINPANNLHNMDEVNANNSSIAKLYINKQGQRALDIQEIQSLLASNMLSVKNHELKKSIR